MKNNKSQKSLAIVTSHKATPEALISQAIQQGATVDTLERLLVIRREVRTEAATEAFNASMSAFQSECPTVKRLKVVKNKDGTKRYAFAPLDYIVEQVRPFIQKHRFSYAIDTEVEDGWVKATCRVTHELGHSSTSTFKVPVDADAYMTKPQKFASALTFAKRYAFCNALGILTGESDTDAVEDDGPKGKKVRAGMTVEDKLEQAKLMIAACKDKATIQRYYKTITEKGPAIYTTEQMNELNDLLMKKAEELGPKK